MEEKRPALVILAAGMGSRYGGLKQLDRLGPRGETIMDYSVRDALAAGYGRVVFVLRKSLEKAFCETILPRYEKRLRVDWVFQEADLLPAGFTPDPQREKPYGTAHAIWAAKDAVQEPFTVINADDFYGADAFRTMAAFSRQGNPSPIPRYAMVAYPLGKTLSGHGAVSRGVCQIDGEGHLADIQEVYQIQSHEGAIRSVGERIWPPDTPVSMNFWGFDPSIFIPLEEMLAAFLTENRGNPTAEFQIPSVINHLIHHHLSYVNVLFSQAEWFGVTYPEDREAVVKRLRALEN